MIKTNNIIIITFIFYPVKRSAHGSVNLVNAYYVRSTYVLQLRNVNFLLKATVFQRLVN